MHGREDADGFVTRFVPVKTARVDLHEDRLLVGFPIVFNSPSRDLGGFRERIMPEAVDRTLRSGQNILALADHKMETTAVLGSTASGRLALTKDLYGLRARIEPPETTVARDVLAVVKAGLVQGMSFRFRVMPGGQDWTREADGILRTITDMEFPEISVVVNPAYLDTSVAARNAVIDAAAFAEYRAIADESWKPSRAFRERQLRTHLTRR